MPPPMNIPSVCCRIISNADGGVNLTCGRTLWSTGERLLDPANARPGSFPAIDGLQGNDFNLVKPANMPPSQAWIVNYYDNQADPASRGHMGAIAIWNVCGGALTTTTPPPVRRWRIGFDLPARNIRDRRRLPCPTGLPGRNDLAQRLLRVPALSGWLRESSAANAAGRRSFAAEVKSICAIAVCPSDVRRGWNATGNGYCRCPQGLDYRDGQCLPPPCPIAISVSRPRWPMRMSAGSAPSRPVLPARAAARQQWTLCIVQLSAGHGMHWRIAHARKATCAIAMDVAFPTVSQARRRFAICPCPQGEHAQ